MRLSVEKQKFLKKLIRKYKLELVILFGSRARGKIHRESDTDIAVRASEELGMDKILSLSAELDRIFINADVCDIRRASPLLLALIAQDGKCLFQKKPLTFENFKIFAINQYIEYKPYFEKLRAKNLEIDKI